MNQILLLVSNNKNRQLLYEYLKKEYKIKEQMDLKNLLPLLDLIIVDIPALKLFSKWIQNQKSLSSRVILPVLLLASRQRAKRRIPYSGKLIDEMILTPIQTDELMVRIRTLLKMRRLSKQNLNDSTEQTHPSAEQKWKITDTISSDTNHTRTINTLQEKNDFFSNVFASIQDGISILDKELNIISVNPTIENWYSHARPIIGKKCYEAYYNRTVPCDVCPSYRTLKTGKTNLEVVAKIGDDSQLVGWLDLYSYPLFDSETGKIKGVIEYVRDITERKRAEEALKESEERFRTLVGSMDDIIFTLDREQRYTGIYGRWIEKNELTPEMYLGKKAREVLGAEVAAVHEVPNQRALTGENVMYNWIGNLDGETRYYQTSVSPIHDSEDRIVGIVGVGRDITENKRVEETLREREENFRALAENAYDGILIAVDDNSHEYINKQTTEITGYPASELLNMGILDLVHPNHVNQIRERLGKKARGESVPSQYETTIIQKDGQTVDVEVSVSKTLWHGEPADLVFLRDITKRKKMEEQIREDIHEKEVMLKEIHHRVKNNMQVISSLLNLQSHYIKDPSALAMFRESQNRIRSMALIHEKLYQSGDLARIDFLDYVKILVQQLFKTFGATPNTTQIKINITNIFLDINTAIPCGLIINELVSNALKHAFPAKREKIVKSQRPRDKIRINLHKNKDETLALIVRDNGIGFPADLDLDRTDSLGMKIISALVRQLSGTIEITRRKGTSFKITFKIEE